MRDLFGGSGSTLIACEQTGRRCYTTEVDALYCDVIVRRWEQFTGRRAERVAAPQEAARAEGEKLFRFLASLMVDRFYGSVTIKFEAGKVTHVGVVARRLYSYKELPPTLELNEKGSGNA